MDLRKQRTDTQMPRIDHARGRGTRPKVGQDTHRAGRRAWGAAAGEPAQKL